jgi:ABC-type sugar transport system ATPase subunit
VDKRYGATHALRGVSLDLFPGTVHALLGENGAGKSTCLGVIAGRVEPDSGSVTIEGAPLRAGSPRAARRQGIYAIYQELTILPHLTAQANVFLGQEVITPSGRLLERAMRERYVELCDEFGVAHHADELAGSLSIADQQVLEIMRACLANARCVLFDEPTASLGEAERQAVFALIGRLRDRSVAVALVSHNLDEVLMHSTQITVFRNGARVAEGPTSRWTKDGLVGAALGDKQASSRIASAFERSRLQAHAQPGIQPVLVVESLSDANVLRDVSFDVRPGEIVGVAGLVGSGRTSLLRALAGLNPTATGMIRIQGQALGVFNSVATARSAGVSLIPEDRKGQGLALDMTSADNIVMGEYSRLSRMGWISSKRLKAAAAAAAVQVQFDTGRLSSAPRTLSGGNQQKVMLGRLVHGDCPILLADEPTRGVDIGAKAQILKSLESMVATGRSLIFVSSELEEVIAMSDRVLVMANGRIIDIMEAALDSTTVESLLHTIFNAQEECRVG